MMSHPALGGRELPARVRLVEPRGYLDFLSPAAEPAVDVVAELGRE
jgi:hypothetical protein